MPSPISTSPSESNSTTRRSGCASARPKANEACPPIAGSPRGTSRFGLVLIVVQCRPPRPGTTIASPRCWLKTLSSSAVSIMTRLLAIETVVLVAHQHGDGPVHLARLLERDGDAWRIGIALDQVIVDVERVEEALGI